MSDGLRSCIITVEGRTTADFVLERVGFFLSPEFIVIGRFLDRADIASIRVFDWQGNDIDFEIWASDESWDLHLARVVSVHKVGGFGPAVTIPPTPGGNRGSIIMREVLGGFRPAVTVPPNVGDMLRIVAPSESPPFEFQGVREHEEFGTVLRISCAPREDGAPIVNEDDELVGVARCRFVDRQEEYGLPLSCVFVLLQWALSSALESSGHISESEPKSGLTAEEVDALMDELTAAQQEKEGLKKKLARKKEDLDEKSATAAYYQELAGRWQMENQRIKRFRELGLIAIAGAIIFAVTVWPTMYRYDRLGISPVRVNRITGKAWRLSSSGWEQLIPSEPVYSAQPEPVYSALPAEELSKLTGTAGWCGFGNNYLCISLYNGSNWVVKGVTVMVTLLENDGTVRWERKFYAAADIAPLSNGSVEFGTGERQERFLWTIVEATGRRL